MLTQARLSGSFKVAMDDSMKSAGQEDLAAAHSEIAAVPVLSVVSLGLALLVGLITARCGPRL